MQLSAIAAGRPPTGPLGLQDDHGNALLRQVQGRRQAGKAAADNADVRID